MIFYDFFYVFVFIYIKISKNLSAKYYQENKERKKSDNMVMNATKISQKMKNKSLLRIEKMVKNEKKRYIMIERKHFNLENFAFLSRKV